MWSQQSKQISLITPPDANGVATLIKNREKNFESCTYDLWKKTGFFS